MKTLPMMKTKVFAKIGFAALSTGALLGVGLPVKAGQLVWVRAQPVSHFRAVGLVPPGSYSRNVYQRPASIAANKAGQGVGEENPTMSKIGQKNARQAANLNKTDERRLNIL